MSVKGNIEEDPLEDIFTESELIRKANSLMRLCHIVCLEIGKDPANKIFRRDMTRWFRGMKPLPIPQEVVAKYTGKWKIANFDPAEKARHQR